MKRIYLLILFIGIGLAVQPPAMAQPTAPPPAATVPAGSLQRVQNAWPAHGLIGASVFNGAGQRVASVRDLLLADDGKVDKVVLAVWRRGKLVAVSFGALQFVPSQRFDTPVMAVRGRMSRMVSVAHGERRPYGIMLPGATLESLAGMESVQLTP